MQGAKRTRQQLLDKAWVIEGKVTFLGKDNYFPRTPEDGSPVAYAGYLPIGQTGPGCPVTVRSFYRETCKQGVYYV